MLATDSAGVVWHRAGALGGAASVVLAAVAVSQLGDIPAADARVAEIAAMFTQQRTGILVAALCIGVGAALFVWFLSVLHAALRSATTTHDPLPTLALVTGTVFALTLAIGYTAGATGAYQLAQEPGAELVQRMLYDFWNNVLAFGRLFFMLGFLAVAVLVFRTAVLPRWIGWVSVALVPLSLLIGAHLFVETGPLSPTGVFAFVWFAVYAVWTIGISIVLARTASPSSRA